MPVSFNIQLVISVLCIVENYLDEAMFVYPSGLKEKSVSFRYSD